MIAFTPQLVVVAIGVSIADSQKGVIGAIATIGFRFIVMIVSLVVVPQVLVCCNLTLYVPWLLKRILGNNELTVVPLINTKSELESAVQVFDNFVIDHVYGCAAQSVLIEILFKFITVGAHNEGNAIV